MTDWVLYNNSLPASTFSTKLIPYYRGNKIRNGSNRSVWEVDFFEPSAPSAQIAVEQFDVYCTRKPIQFLDHSAALDDATYLWEFEGGSPSTSTDRNPTVTYSALGSYNVSLTVSDINGSDTQTLTDLITVHASDCHPERIPDLALDPSNTGHVNLGQPDELDFNGTNHFTFMAWVKPAVNDMNGYVLTKFDRFVAGQYQFGIENGKAYVSRETPPWNVSSNTNLTANNWYHIAGTYDGSQLKIYVDGIMNGAINMTGSINSIDRNILIGARYRSGAIQDHFDGIIEEVSVWKRALSQSEIREYRHLTLDQVSDSDLLSYYQFNEMGTVVYDRNKFNNGTMDGGAVRTNSTAPVGGGLSQTINVNAAGNVSFTIPNIELDFPMNGAYPDGELVVSRIDNLPDQMPNSFSLNPAYWIINNYGSNPNFTELNSIQFHQVGNLPNGVDPASYSLYKRSSNEFGDTWGTAIDNGDQITPGDDGSVVFSDENGITSFSQFVLLKQAALPVELLSFYVTLTDEKQALLSWITSSEVNSDHFIVERSQNGRDFTRIGSQNAAGNSNSSRRYEAIDPAPFRGISYYRIVAYDQDGSFSYSLIRSITFDALPSHFQVFPNPLVQTTQLFYDTDLNEELRLELYNLNGQLVLTKFLDRSSGEIDLSMLAASAYIYKAIGSSFMKTGRIVIGR